MEWLNVFILLFAVTYLTAGAISALFAIERLFDRPRTAATPPFLAILDAAGLSVPGFKVAMFVGYTLLWLPIAIHEMRR